MANTITRRQRDKVQLSAKAAAKLTNTLHAKYEAWAPGVIRFPEEGKRNYTRNVWLLGWSPEHRAWCASNGQRAWRFYNLGAMSTFREALASWNWEVTPVQAR